MTDRAIVIQRALGYRIMILMLEKRRSTAAVLAGGLLTLMAGCAYVHPQPPRHPGPYNDPVDAFNATETPADPTRSPSVTQNHNLGSSLHRLHNAREAYNKDQAQQAAKLRREQAACRANPKARKVKIQDGTDDPDAVYCQKN